MHGALTRAAASRVCQAPYPQLRQRQDLALGHPRGAGVLPLLLWQQFTEPLVGTLRGKKKSGSVVRAGRQQQQPVWAPAALPGVGVARSHSSCQLRRGGSVSAEGPTAAPGARESSCSCLLPTPAPGLRKGYRCSGPSPRHQQHPRTFAPSQPAVRECHRHLPAPLGGTGAPGQGRSSPCPRQRLRPRGTGMAAGLGGQGPRPPPAPLTEFRPAVLTAGSPACSGMSAPAEGDSTAQPRHGGRALTQGTPAMRSLASGHLPGPCPRAAGPVPVSVPGTRPAGPAGSDWPSRPWRRFPPRVTRPQPRQCPPRAGQTHPQRGQPRPPGHTAGSRGRNRRGDGDGG